MRIVLAKTPDAVRSPKKVKKTCNEKDCYEVFYGHPVRKYCKYHLDPKNRIRSRPIYDKVTDNNRVIRHSFINTHEAYIPCMKDGCTEQIKIKIIPKIFIYPKYCDKHRHDYKLNKKTRSCK